MRTAELKRINPQFAYMDINKDAAVNSAGTMICARRGSSEDPKGRYARRENRPERHRMRVELFRRGVFGFG